MNAQLIELRHELHRAPECAGQEHATAATLIAFFNELSADGVIAGLGGTGVAVEFNGLERGPTLMLRAELDALPIDEGSKVAHKSENDGCSHACGHDGHMTILAGVGMRLAAQRPARGRVILLFQPAEETGEGAQAVLDDPKFAALAPDYVFALHNLPGVALGRIICRDGAMCCASRGMIIRLLGRTAHAAQPETGISPAAALSRLLEELPEIPGAVTTESFEKSRVTIVGARLGDRSFGIAPGEAELYATLRSESDESMRRLIELAEVAVRNTAGKEGLHHEIGYEDVFHATSNSESAVDVVVRAAARRGCELDRPKHAFLWSEDFGRFTARFPGALFGIGAGVDCPPLHDPRYDFPDALIEPAVGIFTAIVEECVTAES